MGIMFGFSTVAMIIGILFVLGKEAPELHQISKNNKQMKSNAAYTMKCLHDQWEEQDKRNDEYMEWLLRPELAEEINKEREEHKKMFGY